MSRLGRWTFVSAALAVSLTAMLCLAMFSSPTPSVRAADPVVAVDPASAGVALDDTVDVDIVISDVPETGLWAATVDLRFDASLLEVIELSAGEFPCRLGVDCTISQNADNLNGTIHYDATLEEPATPVGGSGTLVTVTFRGKAVGTSSVAFDSAVLWGPGPADNMTSTNDPGEVIVSEAATDTPEPTPTPTSGPTTTPTPTATNTPGPTNTPEATHTPNPTNTPKPTATPKPPKEQPESTKQTGVGASGSQPTPSGGALPKAGTGEMPNQVWRWFFLSGAIIMGLATWAFTFRFYARQKESERFWHR